MAELGNAIPTKFTPKTEEMMDALCRLIHLDRSEIIRRCVETALIRWQVTGDYRFLMEKDNISLVAEAPAPYRVKRKRKSKEKDSTL